MQRNRSQRGHRSSIRPLKRHKSRGQTTARPATAHRGRGRNERVRPEFNAPEVWHEPQEDSPAGEIRFVVNEPGDGFLHPVSVKEIKRRLKTFPGKFLAGVDVIQLSPMTSKRRLFPCYGMQWGSTVYLYPIEESLVEYYIRPPRPQQLVEAKMYGGRWSQDGSMWQLQWTPQAIADFYLNNVLIHEIGHINDQRNTSYIDRERYADWFAIEYGYKQSRKRKRKRRKSQR